MRWFASSCGAAYPATHLLDKLQAMAAVLGILALELPTGWLGWVAAACERLVPNQAGALCIGFLVTYLVAGDTKRVLSKRNALVLLLVGITPLYMDILKWERYMANQPDNEAGPLLFAALYSYTALFAVTSAVVAFLRRRSEFESERSAGNLWVLVVFLLSMNVTTALGRPADDCGYYTNLAAQRWVETGTLPYGDEKLRGPNSPGFGASATYGPLLVAAHIPFQAALGFEDNDPDANPMSTSYRRPPMLATQLVSIAFHFVGVLSLFLIGRRLRHTQAGLTLVALYTGSAMMFSLGSPREVISGMAFVSHVAPSACVLLALALTNRPFFAGVVLACGAGVLFYPAFFFPLWLGWYVWQRRGAAQFTGGFALAGILIVLLVILCTKHGADESAVSLFLKSTLEHQEGTDAKEYGSSLLSFWGTHPQAAAFWNRPLFGDSSLFKPTFLGFASLCLISFFLARGRDLARLAALTAMLGAAVQLWKTHATGSYVEWYLPLLLIALYARPELNASVRTEDDDDE